MNFRALLRIAGFVLGSGLVASPQAPTHTPAASAASAVPALVPFAGVVAEVRGNSPGEAALVTFQIFKEESGGEALWTETQTVAVDASGHFTVQMGAASANGIPAEIFQTGEARWLEVQVAGEAPRARILLLSVPYALKAADALAQQGIEAEVINLRSLRPLDTATIIESVKKTNRLVTVEEGWPFAGIGAEITMQAIEHAFDWLDAPPVRVHGEDVPLPYAANLEKLALPQAEWVVKAVRKIV